MVFSTLVYTRPYSSCFVYTLFCFISSVNELATKERKSRANENPKTISLFGTETVLFKTAMLMTVRKTAKTLIGKGMFSNMAGLSPFPIRSFFREHFAQSVNVTVTMAIAAQFSSPS
jgi:hypothetical protein